MMPKPMRESRFRVGSVLAVGGLVLSFVLSWKLGEANAFVVVAPVAIGGKWMEATMERWAETRKDPP